MKFVDDDDDADGLVSGILNSLTDPLCFPWLLKIPRLSLTVGTLQCQVTKRMMLQVLKM